MRRKLAVLEFDLVVPEEDAPGRPEDGVREHLTEATVCAKPELHVGAFALELPCIAKVREPIWIKAFGVFVNRGIQMCDDGCDADSLALGNAEVACPVRHERPTNQQHREA